MMGKDLRGWWIGILRERALDSFDCGWFKCLLCGGGVGIFWASVFKRLENVAWAGDSEFLKADSEDSEQRYGDWKRHPQRYGDPL